MDQLQEEGLQDADPPRVLPSHSRTQGSITSYQPNVWKSKDIGATPPTSSLKKMSLDLTHQDPAPEDREQAANPSKSHFMPADTLGDSDKGVHAAPRSPSSHPYASRYGDDRSCSLPQPRGHINPCATSQHVPPGYATASVPPHSHTQASPKKKLAVKTKPSKKRRIAEEAVRGDDNEEHPRESWASYPSPQNRGARDVQDGQLKQRMHEVTNGSDRMAALLRQRDDLEAAFSRHASRDQRRIVEEAIRVAEQAFRGDDNKGHPGMSWALSSSYPNQGAHNIQGGHLRQRRPEVASGSDGLAALLRQREKHNLVLQAALSRPAAPADPSQRIVEEAIRVAEEALRGDGNEGHPGVSWASSSSYPNQGPRNVQEGHLRQNRPDVTSGSDGLASLLREREYRNLELEAALSRHASRDPLYDYSHSLLNSRNRGNPRFSPAASSLATVLTSPRPPTLSQRPNFSLTEYDEQELVEEILQRRRANAAPADPGQRIVEEAIRVAEEALRGDGNEGHPSVSWASSSPYPNQGPHNVQEGHLRQNRPDVTRGSDGLASLLREREYRNLELEAALSRHASRDPLHDYSHSLLNSRNRENPLFSPAASSLATVLTSPRPPTISQRPNLSLTEYNEQELEEILRRRRVNEQELRSYYDNPSFGNVRSDYGTRTYPEDRASMLALGTQARRSVLMEQILGRRGRQYDHHSSDVASTLVAAAPLYDQQRQASALHGIQDSLVPPLRDHPSSFAALCHPIRQQQETTSSTTLAQRMMAEEEGRRRAPEAGGLMRRSPSSSLMATAGTSTGSRDSHLSLSSLQQRASSNVPQIATIPPCEEGPLPRHTERTIVSLSGIEDENWLSDFLSFVRSDLIEVFRASGEDVATRINSKKITYQQIGFRCRFCAHLPHDLRACRSATFPSSIDRIYQSLNMIIRDHFVRCDQVPKEKMAEFSALKAAPSLKTASKQYWYDSAKSLGMMDTPTGIMLDESMMTQHQAEAVSRGVPRSSSVASDPDAPSHVVGPNDRHLVPDYLFTLLMQVQPVYLTEPERVGNRKGFASGMPGLGCRHCYKANRIGWAFYPPKRRLLPIRIKVLRQHLERCSHCPQEIKMCLAQLEKSGEQESDAAKQKMFFDRIWARIHGSIPAGVPADCSSDVLS